MFSLLLTALSNSIVKPEMTLSDVYSFILLTASRNLFLSVVPDGAFGRFLPTMSPSIYQYINLFYMILS